MFYISFKNVVDKFPNKLAVNAMTYRQLLDKSLARGYSKVSDSKGIDILLDVIKAASIDKPIIILPKENKDKAIIPEILPDHFSLILYSSGSTGNKKPIIIPEKMLLANIKNIIEYNDINEFDKILTVCSLNHTAGLTCQTMAGLFVGASVIIEAFNPFNLIRLLTDNQITVTHVVPLMTESLIKINRNLMLPKLRLVWTGSDVIPKSHIEYWLAPNRNVMTVYGMTEAGPPVISHVYHYNDDLSILNEGYAVGTKVFCESKLINDELLLYGDIINIEDWLHTGDCFEYKNGWYFYKGRKSAGGKIIPKGNH